MTPDTDRPHETFLLLACGSSGLWSIDLDESADGTKLCLQLDGPQVYLAFAVKDLGVIENALEYLRAGRTSTGELILGSFGAATVSLHWDNEGEAFGRCFLIVGPTAGSAVRVTLYSEDTRTLTEALAQVVEDLPPEVVTE